MNKGNPEPGTLTKFELAAIDFFLIWERLFSRDFENVNIAGSRTQWIVFQKNVIASTNSEIIIEIPMKLYVPLLEYTQSMGF